MAKVLLVEDDNNLREIYEMSLKAEGYETLSATNGEEALDVAAKNHPDLIISDVMMPKVSGFEMLAKLREDPALKDTPVIMMTALSQSEDKVKADRLGVKKYLVKSQVTLEDLAKVAKELVPPSGAAPTANVEPTTPAPEPPAVAPAEPASAPTPVEPTTSPQPVVEPPSATPAPEPPAVAPAEPAAAPTPVADPATPDQQTSDQEQAAIEAQINAFIDTTSTAANTKTVEATNAPIAQPEPAAPTEDASPSGRKTIQPISDGSTLGPNLNQLVAEEEQKENELKASAPLPTGSVINVENPATDAFSPPVDPQINVAVAPQPEPAPPAGQVVTPQAPQAQVITGTDPDGKPKVDPNTVAL